MEFGHNLEHSFNIFDADDYENFEGLYSFLWSSEYPTFFYFYLLLILMVVVLVMLEMVMMMTSSLSLL